jgi:hypothetical protein
MSNTDLAITRTRMLTSVGFIPSAYMAAAAADKQLFGARNDAQGGGDAWSPPV